MATKKRSDYDLTTAEGALQAYMDLADAVGDYVDPYANDVKNALAAIQKNSTYGGYNAATDPAYAQAAREYKAAADQSARDSYGRATATSGGYANTFAQRVAQQQRDETMAKLSALIPQFAEADYNKYRAEQSDRYDLLAALQGASDRGYNRWADDYSRQQAEIADLLDLYRSNRDREYQKQRDAVADEQWAKEYALSTAARASSGSGSGSGSRGSGSGNNGATTSDLNFYASTLSKMNGKNLYNQILDYLNAGAITDDQAKMLVRRRGVPADKIDELLANHGLVKVNGVWQEWTPTVMTDGVKPNSSYYTAGSIRRRGN